MHYLVAFPKTDKNIMLILYKSKVYKKVFDKMPHLVDWQQYYRDIAILSDIFKEK